jgi:hypothetical protein
MAKAERQPLSKESFDNNADLLVFRDRHEYRTRSRLGYYAAGLFALFGAAFGVWLCVQLLVIWPSQDGAYASSDRITGFIAAPIFLPFSVLLSLLAQGFFRTNPRIVISPAGIKFYNRLGILRLRSETFLVEFDDIDRVETIGVADKNRFEVQPTKFRRALKIFTDERGGLLLRWNTFSREEALRFEDAFVASMKEMATRAIGSR